MTADAPRPAPPSQPWGQLTQDPRRPESAALRASDRDREVVLGVLGEAYADGRLTRQEYDERADAATRSRTLGELPGLLADLVPDRADRPASAAHVVVPDDLHTQAVRRWEAQRRQALTQLVIPSVICWTIWLLSSLHGGTGFHAAFPWPVFVTLGVGAHLIRVLVHRQDIIDEERRRLEKKQHTTQTGRPGTDSFPESATG